MRITEREVLQYLQHLFMLIDSGIPLSQANQLLVKQAHSSEKKQLFIVIQHIILSGNSFAKAIQTQACFHPLIIQLCKIGEETCRFNTCLRFAIDWLEKKIQFKDQLKQLIFYPCLLFISAMALLVILLIAVVPQFSLLFKDHLKELPALTLCIFRLSYFIIQYGVILLIIFILFFIFILKCKNKLFLHFNYYFKSYLFKLPIMKQYEDFFCIRYFTQALSLALHAGIPMAQALPLSFPPFITSRWKTPILPLQQLILTGTPLHQLLRQTKLFPIDIIESIHIGEETRMLAKILKELSIFYEKKLQQLLKRIAVVIEPLIMLCLGILIGIVVVGLYLPIFRLGNTI